MPTAVDKSVLDLPLIHRSWCQMTDLFSSSYYGQLRVANSLRTFLTQLDLYSAGGYEGHAPQSVPFIIADYEFRPNVTRELA